MDWNSESHTDSEFNLKLSIYLKGLNNLNYSFE